MLFGTKIDLLTLFLKGATFDCPPLEGVQGKVVTLGKIPLNLPFRKGDETESV